MSSTGLPVDETELRRGAHRLPARPRAGSTRCSPQAPFASVDALLAAASRSRDPAEPGRGRRGPGRPPADRAAVGRDGARRVLLPRRAGVEPVRGRRARGPARGRQRGVRGEVRAGVPGPGRGADEARDPRPSWSAGCGWSPRRRSASPAPSSATSRCCGSRSSSPTSTRSRSTSRRATTTATRRGEPRGRHPQQGHDARARRGHGASGGGRRRRARAARRPTAGARWPRAGRTRTDGSAGFGPDELGAGVYRVTFAVARLLRRAGAGGLLPRGGGRLHARGPGGALSRARCC